jgi:hypothetical protein
MFVILYVQSDIIDFGPIDLAYSHGQGAFCFDWVVLPKSLWAFLYKINSASLPSLDRGA